MAHQTVETAPQREATLDKRRTSTVSASGELHPALQDLDPSTKYLFYTPHTITGLLIGIAALIYFSGTLDANPHLKTGVASLDDNIRTGLTAAVLVFLGYAILQGPSTSMVRPHPAVWRVVHGVVLVYFLVIVFMLFLTVDQARQLLKLLYPSLGVELPERSYGSDCRLYIPGKGINWETVQATVFDEFVIAHTLGWWGKAIIIRDPKLLWILSVGFEFMELTFSHMLPNFNECWWDSWVLDVLVCNWLGLWAGMQTVRWVGSLEYNWGGISRQPTIIAKARRSLAQFWPHSWDTFHWGMFSNPMRLMQCLALVAVFLLVEVNAFFLKYILWVPPLNPLNTYRLVLFFLMGIPAVREYYIFIENQEVDMINKLGPFAWLAAAVAFAETLVCIKFGHGMFQEPWPATTLYVWGSVTAVFILSMLGWSLQRQYGARRTGSKKAL